MKREDKALAQNELIQMLEKIKKLADECISQTSHTPRKMHGLSQTREKIIKFSAPHMNFDLNERAFVKKYAKPLSGPKKFVLIIAYLSKGQISKDVSLENIKKMWGGMSGLIGTEFNTFYAVAAKDNGWVNPVKRGVYILTASWKEIFDHE